MSEVLTASEKAEHAIQWITYLPDYPQALNGTFSLGNHKEGYDVIGAGCAITNTPHGSDDWWNNEFTNRVGMMDSLGAFPKGTMFFKQSSLADIHSFTSAGFKKISTIMKNHPEKIFHPEVALLIREHFDNLKPLKAYTVTMAKHSTSSVLVLARNVSQAKKMGYPAAKEVGNDKFTDVRATRFPHDDKVASEPAVISDIRELWGYNPEDS